MYNPSEIKLSDIELRADGDWDPVSAPGVGPGVLRLGNLRQDVFVTVFGKTWKHPTGAEVLLANFKPLSGRELSVLNSEQQRLIKVYGTRIVKLDGEPQLVVKEKDNLIGGPRLGGRRRRNRRTVRRGIRKNLHTRRIRKYK